MTNETELRALYEWVARVGFNERARITRGPYSRVGALGTTKTVHPSGDRIKVTVRDPKRAAGRQYATVFSLDDLEIKVNGRYVPAREVVAIPTDETPERWLPPSAERVPIINIHPDARAALSAFLLSQDSPEQPYFAYGYSEFIMDAVARAKREVADA